MEDEPLLSIFWRATKSLDASNVATQMDSIAGTNEGIIDQC